MVVFLCFRPLPTPFTLAFRLFSLTSYPFFPVSDIFSNPSSTFSTSHFLLPLPGLSVPLVMPLSSPSTPSTLSSVKVLISVPFCSHFHFLLLLFLFVSPFIPSPLPSHPISSTSGAPFPASRFLAFFPFLSLSVQLLVSLLPLPAPSVALLSSRSALPFCSCPLLPDFSPLSSLFPPILVPLFSPTELLSFSLGAFLFRFLLPAPSVPLRVSVSSHFLFSFWYTTRYNQLGNKPPDVCKKRTKKLHLCFKTLETGYALFCVVLFVLLS